MRRFVYYNNGFGVNGQPTQALHYYNYMNGIWKNGQRMAYGGDGISAGTGANLEIPADYMFPGDTDPYNWGTQGVNVTEDWSEYELEILLTDSFYSLLGHLLLSLVITITSLWV